MSQINKKNLFWNSLTFIAISLLGFFNFSLNLKTYESEIFGFYLLISSYWGIGSSIDFGFGVSSIKNISEAIKIYNYDKINKIINSYLIVYFSLSLILIIFIYFFYYIFTSINYNLIAGYSINILFVLFAIAFLFRYLSSFFFTIYEGLSEFILMSKINLVLTIFNTLLTIIIYVYKLSLYYLVSSQLIFSLFLFVSMVIILKKKFNFVKYSKNHIKWGYIKKDGVYNANLQFSFVINSIIDPVLKSIISLFLGLNFVSYFETAKKLINLSNGLLNSALKGLLNKISVANAEGSLKNFVNKDIYQYSSLGLDFSILLYGILNPLICIFILLWFDSYSSLIIFLLFLLPYSIINIGGPLYSVLMIEGRASKLSVLQLLNLILLSLFFFLGIIIFNNYLGIIGFYVATILNSYLMVIFLKKYIGFEVVSFFKNINTKYLIKLNVLLIAELLFCLLYPDHIYFIMAIYFLISIFIFKKTVIYFLQFMYNKFRVLLIKN